VLKTIILIAVSYVLILPIIDLALTYFKFLSDSTYATPSFTTTDHCQPN
jgi:hypothetical protein